MAQGMSKAVQAMAAACLALFLLLLTVEVVESTEYKVGESGGWSIDAATWAAGKTFYVGDTLSRAPAPAIKPSSGDSILPTIQAPSPLLQQLRYYLPTMAQGMSKVVQANFSCLVLLLLLLLAVEIVESVEYKIGDDRGWSLEAASWADGKIFYVGDTLYFKYTPGQHSLMVVDREVYETCNWDPNAPMFRAGSNLIELLEGYNYFISTVNDDCTRGMKLAIEGESLDE
ncbi:Chemocyanin [Apostasia shenzhenica]|uniref:Chemocyanin n=1 Tax=Apostasia shenzhenica TaxID=1088818 RepID=A0A2I0BAQ8_9ASPA|nr:Chemocyanin [Apostasia shenzhenica]